MAVLVVALGLVATVAACGEEDPQDQATVTGSTQADVQVTGSAWSPPSFAYDTPLTVTAQRMETVWEGVGPKVKDGDVVVLDTYAEDGRTRKVVANSFAGSRGRSGSTRRRSARRCTAWSWAGRRAAGCSTSPSRRVCRW
ncbi:hypothetical protein GCM10025864_38750 [Luteimicrobium album]|uniref:Uncharacterized protein n=1 Tax=Luteimicrobium album TaxID=1054550 RepID=A0ABQ6I745_9MICO|nr:hypothetical protein GCM10025864_38750 [Luteimicrobium album]